MSKSNFNVQYIHPASNPTNQYQAPNVHKSTFPYVFVIGSVVPFALLGGVPAPIVVQSTIEAQ